jgi:hypothetical protein
LKKVDKTKFKTELCKNWIESGFMFCRYGDKCQFAHGIEDIRFRHEAAAAVPKNYKSKECA